MTGILLFGFFISPPAFAARFSGDYLLQVCASDKNGNPLVPGGHIACQAYIAGILDYHNLIRSMGAAPGIDFCVPDRVTMNSLQDRVASYIFKNKKDHGAYIASPAVAMAMFYAYPCK